MADSSRRVGTLQSASLPMSLAASLFFNRISKLFLLIYLYLEDRELCLLLQSSDAHNSQDSRIAMWITGAELFELPAASHREH